MGKVWILSALVLGLSLAACSSKKSTKTTGVSESASSSALEQTKREQLLSLLERGRAFKDFAPLRDQMNCEGSARGLQRCRIKILLEQGSSWGVKDFVNVTGFAVKNSRVINKVENYELVFVAEALDRWTRQEQLEHQDN